jgi:hypothetical protein
MVVTGGRNGTASFNISKQSIAGFWNLTAKPDWRGSPRPFSDFEQFPGPFNGNFANSPQIGGRSGEQSPLERLAGGFAVIDAGLQV